MSDGANPRPTSRAGQLVQVFRETSRADPRMLPLVLGLAVATLAVFLVVGWLTDTLLVTGLIGLLAAVLVGLQIFSRRATAAAMRNLEGKSGAAAAVLSSLRRPWRVTPAIAFNRRQDFVHLAVGRPGVVLVAEGAPAGATALLRQERRRVARVIGDAPIHEIVVGDGQGQVPLSKLSTEFLRLPRSIKKEEIEPLDSRIKALGSSSPPMPKGPIPRGRRPR
jgi:hypothetical protein